LDNQTVVITSVSDDPRIFLVDNLMSDEETDHFLKVAQDLRVKQMAKSTIGAIENKKVDSTRTSSHTWIGHDKNNGIYNDEIVDRVERRFHALGRSEMSLAESMQLVFYDRNQHYHLHRDYGEPKESSKNPVHLAGGNRFATLLLYINDVDNGGETIFPYVTPKGEKNDHLEFLKTDRWPEDVCTTTKHDFLKVTPRKGRVVIFYSLHEKGNFVNKNHTCVNRASLHMGCHVLDGEKYVVNVWLRNKRVDGKLINGDT